MMHTSKPLKMQSLKLMIVGIFCLFSLQTFGQEVPKAFEVINYKGKINDRVVRLMLANGYIGASSIKLYAPSQTKPLTFEPDAGVADENDRLRFITEKQDDPDCFILDNMQDAYEETPALITGIYFAGSKKTLVTFRLIKPHKH